MGTGDLISIHPSELKFQFKLKKQSSCSLQMTNITDKYVAFKVKTTNPKKYCVRPNIGVLLPRTTCNVTVTMQAPKEAPPDLQCKDKFLLQCVVALDGTTTKDITQEMFNKEDGKVMEEFKLRVNYIPANPPSPVPKKSEGSPPRSSVLENGYQNRLSFDAEGSIISKLTEEKNSALQQNQKLHRELDLLKKEINQSGSGGFSFSHVVLVGFLSILVGYLVK